MNSFNLTYIKTFKTSSVLWPNNLIVHVHFFICILNNLFIFKTSMLEVKSRYFDERHSHGVLLDVILNGVTHSQNELVGHHEDQDVGSFHRLRQVWNGYLTEREMR